ncbi:hypothetical protein KDH_26260 [Dictyobacter sp. S3.2.2.5]|uniref:Uncharacterized protein n=1 Tax=Dictyobacter halimunensis TaxID=3026934 RepID=A0ABQ6FPY7_9CHLR|nr:hypothetical protein KDH_26260 [Dictyobacter sp. S3.2.2.5]
MCSLLIGKGVMGHDQCDVYGRAVSRKETGIVWRSYRVGNIGIPCLAIVQGTAASKAVRIVKLCWQR